ncbi:MAG: DUF881 domain-containing protein [Clostridia bacterium]|nr:DUF881 domain-containing protein [Clostridia bacterium]
MEKIKNVTSDFIKKHNIVSYLFIGIAMFFLALMLAAQMKAVSDTTEVAQGKREAQLIDDLRNIQNKYNDLKVKYEDKSKIVEEYKNNASNNDSLIASMKEEQKQLSIISGVTDVVGEGIIITLTDGENVTDSSLRTDTLVHDSDVLTVVNELKAAGAEAISVNDQRIIAGSAIRCVGPVIQVNYQKVAAPFVIKAVGNAQYLESAMNIKNGVADLLKELGIGVKITREKEVKILKFDGTINFKTARLAE